MLSQAEKFFRAAYVEDYDASKALAENLRAEGARLHQVANALLLGLLTDEYTPAELFKPWASIARIRQWRDNPTLKLDAIVRHGRCCVRPSAFFALWNSLPDESSRRRGQRMPRP